MTTSQVVASRFGLLILFPFPFWTCFQPHEGGCRFLDLFPADSWQRTSESAVANNEWARTWG